MRHRTAVIFLLSVLSAESTAAQTVQGGDPNMTRGVSAAGRLFSPNDLDVINQFTGHLTVRIPIGQSYPVGPFLSTQLMLTNNSSVWEYRYELWDNYPGGPQGLHRHALPEN